MRSMMLFRYTLVASALLPDVVLATLNQFISADLVWPKPQARYNKRVDDVTVAPEDQLGPYSAAFACFYVPVPENVERIPWPIRGGQIQINYTSEIWSSDDEIDNDSMGWWSVDEAFGQFRGLDNKGSENIMTSMDRYFLPSYPSANATWRLGTSCLNKMRTFDVVHEDPRLHLETGEPGMAPSYNVSVDEMEGVEATLGVSFAYHVARDLVQNADGYTGDVFSQCVYVRFTSDPVEGPRCRPEETELSPSPTSPDAPEPTLPGGPDEDEIADGPGTGEEGGRDDDGPVLAPNPPLSSSMIGVAAGISSGVAIAIIVLAFWLHRRRRARRALAASLLATAESGARKPEKKAEDIEKAEKKKDKKVEVDCDLIMVQEAVAEADRTEMVRKGKKVDDGSDDASSGYSEPLPKYEEKPKE